MKLRILGYTLVLIGFGFAMNIIWPSLYGNYPFMPPWEYMIPADTGEMVSAHAAFMQKQTIIEINHVKQARMLYPLLIMFCGAIALDIAGRKNRTISSEQDAALRS